MSTSLVLVDHETVDYKYALALLIFSFDMECRELGISKETNYNPYLMNHYIDEALALLH